MFRSSTKRRRPRAEDFTLGWICALHIELTAAKALLDEEYEGSDDTAQYALGRIGRHDVVISCLPAGQLGTAIAAAAATEMQSKFPSLQLNLLVGIGGGVPSPADIRLGDVVISVPQGTYGGVVQYDSGKSVTKGLLKRTGSLNTPPPILLTAVNNLRANVNAGRSNIPEYLASMAHLKGFSRHDAGPDLLFHSSYPHIEGTTCSECGEDMLTIRPKRDSEQVVIHYGTIASGNQVIKEAAERDRLSAELGGVLCFEMEAAGLMNILQCLVVRGICDYADSHKNKKWQPFAAAAAAACAKEILSFVPAPSQRNAPQQWDMRQYSGLESNGCIDMLEPYEESEGPSIEAHTAVTRSILTAEQRERCLDTLRFEQIESRHATIRTAHIKTCRWLLTKSEYLEWLNTEKLSEHHGLLWIKGNPGTGKSTIMKFAAANAGRSARKDMSNVIVISFFFNARGSELEKSVLGMYRSLLVQLLEGIPDLQIALTSIRLTALKSNELPTWDLDTARSLFQHSVENLGQRSLICFIDALDECDEDEVREMVAFFEELGCLAVSSGLNLRVCFSSRHYPSITIGKGIELLLDGQEGHYQDITNYVHSELKGSHDMDQIKAEIIEKSSGIFLWVVLVIPMLNKEYAHGRMRALRQRLNEIPKGLEQLFKSILTRDEENIESLILCLQWILFAKRPLKREELYFAILAGAEPEALKAWDVMEDSKEAMDRYILSTSKGLAELTRSTKTKGQTVQFIHESVRDFFLKENGFGEIWRDLEGNLQAQSHERLKQCCLNYISVDLSSHIDVNKPLPKASLREAKALRKLATNAFPFLEYAVHNVLHHADMAEGHGISQGDFLRSFQLAYWLKLDNLFERNEIRRHTPNVSLLYILAECNCSNLIGIQPSISSYLDVEDERYGLPLFASLATGSEDAVKTFVKFLSLNRSPASQILESCNGYYQSGSRKFNIGRGFNFSDQRTVLSYIAELGNDLIFSVLLETGKFDINSKDEDGRTPLWWAVDQGHAAVVNLLLETGKIDFTCETQECIKVLHLAIHRGHEAVVELLMKKGKFNFNLKNPECIKLLHLAISRGNESVVRLILETCQFDVELKNQDCTTLLHLAIDGGHLSVLELLLETGNLFENLKDFNLTRLLQLAIDRGHTAAVKLLLKTGKVDVNTRHRDGRTLLSFAAGHGWEDVVKLLLETGKVDVNTRHRDGQTPLSFAAEDGWEGVVKLLLQTGQVDVNIKDEFGWTPLSRAVVAWFRDDVVKLLLKTEYIDVDPKDKQGRTPLSLAAGCGCDTAVKLLLETGKVDMKSKDKDGRTPLSWAASGGHQYMVKTLLEIDNIDVEWKDLDGRTPLSWAAGSGRDTIVKLLLETGKVDINSRDKDGRTPLSWAAGSGHQYVVKTLLEIDNIDVELKDSDGRTPLSWAAGHGEEPIYSSRTVGSVYDPVVKRLLETGKVNINSKDKNGRTPLSWATYQGNRSLVKMLGSYNVR